MSSGTDKSKSESPKSLFGYEVRRYIGSGAGSKIYEVVDPTTRGHFALKHVERKAEKDIRFVEQLEAEYEVGRKIVHPNLRKSISYKVSRTLLRRVTEAALVMELFDGEPLEACRPQSIRQTVDIFIKVAHALEALHKADFVHCDLKPNNILFRPDGTVKVIDLGQTCKLNTVKSRIQGTPDYISPEQVKCLSVSPKTDVYNFGATLYWTLTGRNMPTLFTIKKGENSLLADSLIETPAQINPRCPEPLSNVVMECVKVRPEKRPEMSDVTRRLEVIAYALEKAAMQAAQRRAEQLEGSHYASAAT